MFILLYMFNPGLGHAAPPPPHACIAHLFGRSPLLNANMTIDFRLPKDICARVMASDGPIAPPRMVAGYLLCQFVKD